jgi:hypothetical protein
MYYCSDSSGFSTKIILRKKIKFQDFLEIGKVQLINKFVCLFVCLQNFTSFWDQKVH